MLTTVLIFNVQCSSFDFFVEDSNVLFTLRYCVDYIMQIEVSQLKIRFMNSNLKSVSQSQVTVKK